jgi:4-hydroxy-tetrahydrodipicolinate synthase
MKSTMLSGIIPPLLTPLTDDQTVDEAGVRRLIEHVLAGGVHGVFVLGSSGEGPMLVPTERVRLVQTAATAIHGRVPLLVGVSDCSVARVRETMEALALPGVDAFVATLPFYGDFTAPLIQVRFYGALAKLSPRPLFLYNIPQAVHSVIEPETMAELFHEANIIGVKDSYGDMERFQRTLTACRERSVSLFQGAELMAGDSLLLGAQGIVSGLSNLAPHWLAQMWTAAAQSDWSTVNALQERLSALWTLHTHGYWLSCLKTAASLLGLCGAALSSPLSPPLPQATEQIRALLQAEGLL